MSLSRLDFSPFSDRFDGTASDQNRKRRRNPPQPCVRRSPWLGRVLERMSCGYADGESYADLVSSLLYGGDPYLLLADFDDYAATHERLYATIADPAERARLSLVNIARSGIFAADRAIRDYANTIWLAKPVETKAETKKK